MQWAAEGTGNTNPVISINGDTGIDIIRLDAKAGTDIRLNASKSFDRENDKLSYSWEVQNFASYCPPAVSLKGKDTPVLTVSLPEEASGCIYHIILTVHDDGEFNLPSYRRVIISAN